MLHVSYHVSHQQHLLSDFPSNFVLFIYFYMACFVLFQHTRTLKQVQRVAKGCFSL